MNSRLTFFIYLLGEKLFRIKSRDLAADLSWDANQITSRVYPVTIDRNIPTPLCSHLYNEALNDDTKALPSTEWYEKSVHCNHKQ